MIRKTIVLTLFLIILSAPAVGASNQSEYEKALLSLMFKDIYTAVNDHYEIEGIQFENDKILDLKITDGVTFDITVQISTFIGAHNTIGTDTLKFKRKIDGGLKLVSYDHTPSEHKDEILQWYFNRSVLP